MSAGEMSVGKPETENFAKDNEKDPIEFGPELEQLIRSSGDPKLTKYFDYITDNLSLLSLFIVSRLRSGDPESPVEIEWLRHYVYKHIFEDWIALSVGGQTRLCEVQSCQKIFFRGETPLVETKDGVYKLEISGGHLVVSRIEGGETYTLDGK